MSAFPGVSSYQSSSLGSKFVVIGVVCCQEMRRNALFHKVLPVLTKYFKELLGMYSYQHKERHILLNSNMDYITTQMVCGHEIGHDVLHREQAKVGMGLQEFTLFDMRNEMEYEANAFSAHLRIDNEELFELMGQGYDVVQLSSIMGTNINLTLIKLNELNRMGCQLNLPYIPRSDFLKNVTL